MAKRSVIDEIMRLGLSPDQDQSAWLEGSSAAVDFLKDNGTSGEIVLYAHLGAILINSVLAPASNVTPPDISDLSNAQVFLDGTWSLAYSYGDGKPDAMSLDDPMNNAGCASLVGGEKLIFRRALTGVKRREPVIELSQRFVHALGLHFEGDQSAYCRLNDQGDIEPIIKMHRLPKGMEGDSCVAITITAYDLHRYMAVTNMALVRLFDATRVDNGMFSGWNHQTRFEQADEDLSYNGGTQYRGSYVNGRQIIRSRLTIDNLIAAERRKRDPAARRYATFKAYDWRNQRVAEISCAPTALTNYFEKAAGLPFELSPTFFRPDVLTKYKADPDKYTLGSGSITCRNSWYLRSYDVNDEGQIHTYLQDLAALPYDEQLYWLSFNEWPKAGIAKRAYTTDFLGAVFTEYDPMQSIRSKLDSLDAAPPNWWSPRGEEAYRSWHYPLTTSSEEWANAILMFDQVLVEGFRQPAIRARLDAAKRPYEKDWQSLKLIEECLIAAGSTTENAKKIMAPLKNLHRLRSLVKGHLADTERGQAEHAARSEHGSLKGHFRALASDCDEALTTIQGVLANLNPATAGSI